MSILTQLQAEVRQVNELNGWFDRERPFSADIALLHSEVSELFGGLELNDAANVAEEFADILIRLLDTAERRKWNLEREREFTSPDPMMGTLHLGQSPARVAARLHRRISEMYEAYRNAEDVEAEACIFLRLLHRLAGQHNVDLFLAVTQKLHRNRERGYRHGGKVE